MMKFFVINIFLLSLCVVRLCSAGGCGCKKLRDCYVDMLENLTMHDEAECIEDAAIGTSTVTVFLKALSLYCGQIFSYTQGGTTFEGRHLYEVVISAPHDANEVSKSDEPKPVIFIEAGQMAGTESVGLALYIIQQLTYCQELEDMIKKYKWVILPSTNPDGLEYARYSNPSWTKNMRVMENGPGFGVDISRNFEPKWNSCDEPNTPFSPIYPGEVAGSENETIFIKDAIKKYQKDAKLYISIKRNGHALLYPYGFTKDKALKDEKIKSVAEDVAAKVNMRAGAVQVFASESIYQHHGGMVCGNSVDHAYSLDIPLAYEMRVFFGDDSGIMTMFHSLPKGFEGTLRNGYFTAFKEIYNAITNDKKKGTANSKKAKKGLE